MSHVAPKDTILIEEVSRIVNKLTGVQLGSNQRTMVQFRLTKRMLDLGITLPEDYLNYLKAHYESESQTLVSLLTTHHTFFFREFQHFEFLEKKGLAELIAGARAKGRKILRFWSAACSYGQEVYSLAMFLDVHLKRLAPDMDYEIFGSDVDRQAVGVSQNAVYRWDEIKEIPQMYLQGHWARGTGDIKDFVKAKPSIKARCTFDTVNLIEFGNKMAGQKFDAVFCRNVFIYFTPDQIKTITRTLVDHLEAHGLLFIGLSENLNGIDVPVESAGPSIFAHKGFALAKASAVKPQASVSSPLQKVAPVVAPANSIEKSGPIKVFCIDDSSTVLTLLKKIFGAEEEFQVIGTADNGLDAAEKLKTIKPDVITLDIHMPKQNGIEYLEKNFKPGHPPVVIISSVSREDANLGIRALQLGATDYVEKPALQDLTERGDEIRTKIRIASRSLSTPRKLDTKLEKQFAKKFAVKLDDKHIKVLIAGLGNTKAINAHFADLQEVQPPTFLFVHGSDKLIAALAGHIKVPPRMSIEVVEQMPAQAKPGTLYIGDFKKLFPALKAQSQNKRVSIMIFGDFSKAVFLEVATWKTSQIILEDIDRGSVNHRDLKAFASYIIPLTSFDYHACQFLSEGV